MNRQPHSNLLSHLTYDKQIKIKQSQSSQYAEPSILNQISQLYNDVFNKMEQVKLHFGQQNEPPYWSDPQHKKIAYIRTVLDFFIDKFISKNQSMEESISIKCQDCRNYEQYLQKLENDIRQHIRLQQQLKLYQESLQQKIQDQKKQSEKHLQQVAQLQSALENHKVKQNNWSQKIVKLEEQNQKMKQQFIKSKTDFINQHSHRTTRQMSQSKSFRALRQMKQMKQNIVMQRNSHKKDDKKEEKKQVRKSLEKRPASSDKLKNNLNGNSAKKYPIVEKLPIQKNKQERKKLIQAKFQLRR